MWVMVCFDLPVKKKQDRREYARFRRFLLDDGYAMLQFSVYARPCASFENTAVHAERIRVRMPPKGQVRMMLLTDKQWGRTEVFFGKNTRPVEKAPQQLSLF